MTPVSLESGLDETGKREKIKLTTHDQMGNKEYKVPNPGNTKIYHDFFKISPTLKTKKAHP